MRRLIAWLRRPYDRCTVGGHRMGTKAGYTTCRKHGDGSGSVRARYTFDLRPTSAAAVIADVRELPIRTSSVRWVMADPPYDQEYAEALWSMGKQYPTPTVLLREIGRILRPGGRAAFLHHLVPTLPAGMVRVGTYGVTTGTGYRIRALTIAERDGSTELVSAGANEEATA